MLFSKCAIFRWFQIALRAKLLIDLVMIVSPFRCGSHSRFFERINGFEGSHGVRIAGWGDRGMSGVAPGEMIDVS